MPVMVPPSHSLHIILSSLFGDQFHQYSQMQITNRPAPGNILTMSTAYSRQSQVSSRPEATCTVYHRLAARKVI
jgi:hypothetical protein